MTADRVVLATDGRYQEQARRQAPECELIDTRTYSETLVEVAHASGVQSLGCEGDHVSWNLHQRISSLGVQIVPTSGLVEAVRMVKDRAEIAFITQACNITERALTTTLNAIHVGISERKLARIFSSAVMDYGADSLAFEPIVAIGENSAIPHHRASDRCLAEGDVVLFDVGAAVAGYCADLSRTVVLGAAPERLVEIHEVVARAQTVAKAGVRAGVAARAVDELARDVIAAAGYADQYVHGTGHGLGLAIHEPPLLGASSVGTLGEHFVVTVEPGIYLPGVGGVRIEDTVLVTSSGHTSLTTGTRELVEISL